MKETFLGIVGILGGAVASSLGGFDNAIVTLVLFMGIDYITGVMVAAVFNKSSKTASGALSSEAGLKGLCKKAVILLVVMLACRLELVTGSEFIRDAVIIAFIVNEGISIVENVGKMGVPMPEIIIKAIEALKGRTK